MEVTTLRPSMRGKLDLRTGRPVWFAYRVPSVPTKKLTRDVKADVAIVGLGISGAMIAEALTAEGRTVVAIDRRGPMKARPPRRRRWCCSRSTSR